MCPSLTSFEPAGQIRPVTFAVSLSPTYFSVDRGKLTYSSQCSHQANFNNFETGYLFAYSMIHTKHYLYYPGYQGLF